MGEAPRSTRALKRFGDAPALLTFNAAMHFNAGDYFVARRRLEQAIERQPGRWHSHRWLAMTYGTLGNVERGREHALTAERLQQHVVDPFTLASLAYFHGRFGFASDAERIAAELERIDGGNDALIGPGHRAIVALARRDADETGLWLQRAPARAEAGKLEPGFYSLFYIKTKLLSDPLLESPDLRALRRRFGYVGASPIGIDD